MKIYVAPHYECEEIQASDVILASAEIATVSKLNSNNAQVTASIWDVLGLR